MKTTLPKRGLTPVEVLVVIVIVGVLVALLVVAIQAAREKSRLNGCSNNLNQIGEAMQEYHKANKRFPPTMYTQLSVRSREPAHGFSWIVGILPQLGLTSLYEPLDMMNWYPDMHPPLVGPTALPALSAVSNTLLPELVCPSNPHALWACPAAGASPPTDALTNYKAMDASHWQSLARLIGYPRSAVIPLYPDISTLSPTMTAGVFRGHPDGGMRSFVGTSMGDFVDGTSHTILCVETIDDTVASRWCDGTQAVCFGLNPYRAVTGNATVAPKNPLTPADFSGFPAGSPKPYYYAPTNYKRYRDGDTYHANTAALTVKPAIACDYDPLTGREKGQYTWDAENLNPGGSWGGPNLPHYGPSSAHKGVVNHLMADGAVKGFTRDIDPALYFFLCTRNGNDPCWDAPNKP
jgi:competence protein ComGC